MKKLGSMLLAAVLVLSLFSGCSTYTDDSGNSGTVAASGEEGGDEGSALFLPRRIRALRCWPAGPLR